MATEVQSCEGVLNVAKESGWTSHDVVAKLRRVFGIQKIGHAGTLDPAATGVLPVLVGRGTRIAEYLLDWEKEYVAVLRLGAETDTQDATGKVLERRDVEGITINHVKSVASQFLGPIMQRPPMYSAVKVGGVPLYKVARAGKTVAREPREVRIFGIEVLEMHGCDVVFRIECSKGTYMRTLCSEIGERLGVGGHLLSLERRRVGPLSSRDAFTVEQLQARNALGDLGECLMSLDQALQAYPAVVVHEGAAKHIVHGVPVSRNDIEGGEGLDPGTALAGPIIRIKTKDGRLLALASPPASPLKTGGMVHPEEWRCPIVKVLVPQGE